MNPERLARAFDVFKRALDVDEPARAAFVDAECADDADVRAEVLAMLVHHAESGSFLEPPDAATLEAAAQRVREGEKRRRYGEFELIEAMPRGGMGVVHRAYQPSLDRVVALKILSSLFAPTPSEVDRFMREARAVARLDHPGIVKVFQVGETDGDHWFAMEFVDGRDLHQELLLAKGELPGDPRGPRLLPDPRAPGAFATVATLVAAAADAIQHAHEHGIVHRDVKPSNLLLDRAGHLRVADFGLAKDESQGSLTKTGDVAGTAAYMSPEQARVTKAKVDHRTDIYSLGVVLYELLTLKRPYEGKTSRDIIDRIGATEPPPIRKVNPRVPRDLALVCEKAMSREPGDRYRSAAEFAKDLRRFVGHEAVEARGVGWWRRVERVAVRRRAVLRGTVIAIAAGASAHALRVMITEGEPKSIIHVDVQNGSPSDLDLVVTRKDDLFGECAAADQVDYGKARRLSLAVGEYRFRLYRSGSLVSERDVSVGLPNDEVTVRIWVKNPAELGVGMRRIRGARTTVRFHVGVDPDVRIREEAIVVADHWMDVAPTSNGEYAEFLAATNWARRPEYWSLEGRASEFARLPVTGITLADMREFAAWSGKRLPTLAELLLAFRGPQAVSHPWVGSTEAQLSEEFARYNFDRPGLYDWKMENGKPGEPAAGRWYLVMMRPVQTAVEQLAGPNELGDMFGNVWQMTETWPISLRLGKWSGSVLARTAIGGSCTERSNHMSRSGLTVHRSCDTANASVEIGFRCVSGIFS